MRPDRAAARLGLILVVLAAAMLLTWPTPAAHAQPPGPADPPPSATIVLRAEDPDQQPTRPPTATRTPTPPPTETLVPSTPTPSTTPPPLPTGTATGTEIPLEPGVPYEERPVIVVEGFDVDPDQPSPGATFQLTLHVANQGEHFAENVQLTLSSTTFLPTNQGSVLYVNSIDEDESVDLGIALRVASDAKAGVYPINIALRWDDSYDGKYTDDTSIGIAVGGASAVRPLLTVISTRLPGRVAPAVPFNLSLVLLNTGGRQASNVAVVPAAGPLAAQGPSGGPLNIPPGAQATVNLRMAAAAQSAPGAVSQTIELRYDDPDGNRSTEMINVGLVVTGEDGLGPQPLISGYRVRDPQGGRLQAAVTRTLRTLYPGQVFLLEIDLQNVGVVAADNTRMSLGGGSTPTGTGTGTGASGTSLGVFAPVGTSNVRYLGSLAAGESRTVEQAMVIDGTAKPGVYVLDVDFSFVDANGQAQSTSEVISLLVDRQVLFEVKPVSVVTSTFVGDTMPFVVDLINLGTSTVNAANARIVPGRALEVADPATATQYVGPLDGGGFFTFETQLVPATPGKGRLKFEVEYFDSFNQAQTFEQTFDVEIEDAPEQPEQPAEPAPEPVSLPWRVLRGFLGLGATGPEAAPAALPEGAIRMEGPAEGP